jgi:hypothetical protein
MKMAPVESSNIKAIGYNALALELHVEFKSGKTFAYKYVSPEDYVRLIQADSIGKHFVQFVKPGKEAVQVLGKPVEVVGDNGDVLLIDSSKAKTYTINGKTYTEFDINKRCAELLGFKIKVDESNWQGQNGFTVKVIRTFRIDDDFVNYSPCTTSADTDAIIDKCWDELMSSKDERGCGIWTHWDHVKWQRLMNEHNCTKLIAACICYIENNDK